MSTSSFSAELFLLVNYCLLIGSLFEQCCHIIVATITALHGLVCGVFATWQRFFKMGKWINDFRARGNDLQQTATDLASTRAVFLLSTRSWRRFGGLNQRQQKMAFICCCLLQGFKGRCNIKKQNKSTAIEPCKWMDKLTANSFKRIDFRAGTPQRGPEGKFYQRFKLILTDSRLNSQAKLLALVYFYHSNKTGFGWPSLTLLQKETGMNRHTVIKYQKQLCELKIMQKTTLDQSYAKCVGKFGRSSSYRFF